MPTAELSSGSPAYPILMVTTNMRLKLYYSYVVSQPATVRILAKDVQVVTAPPYKESLGRQGHAKNIVKTDRSRVRLTPVTQTLMNIWNVQDRNIPGRHTHGIALSTAHYQRRLGRAIATRRSPSGSP